MYFGNRVHANNDKQKAKLSGDRKLQVVNENYKMMVNNIHDMAGMYIVNVHVHTTVDGDRSNSYFSYIKTSQFQMLGFKFEG